MGYTITIGERHLSLRPLISKEERKMVMSREFILSELRKLDDVELYKPTETHVELWDDNNGKYLTYCFNEAVTVENLSQRVYVSPNIPDKYKNLAVKSEVVNVLLTKIDRNCFLTMAGLYIIYSDDESEEECPDRLVLEEATGDEYAHEVGLGCIGVTWWERNICIVNLAGIIKVAEDLWLGDYQQKREVEIGLWTTIIHELRHLLLDTNIILPEDQYPIELAAEEAVEEYCRRHYEKHY